MKRIEAMNFCESDKDCICIGKKFYSFRTQYNLEYGTVSNKGQGISRNEH